MEATILYETDHHHSYASQRIIGVFTNKKMLLQTARKFIEKDQEDQFDTKEERRHNINWHIEFFQEKGQTQGLCHSELYSVIIELNKAI